MDLGMLGSDLLVGSGSCLSSSLLSSESEPRQKWVGSGFLKQQRTEDFDWRSSKVAKTEDNSASKAILQQQLQQRGPLLRSNTDGTASLLYDHGQQMLSFSSPNSQAVTFPNYYSNQSRNTGYGGMNAGSIQGVLTGLRGPFTQSQWMELEHQALIYKYITANVPVPTNLLFPIRKALDSAGFSSFSSVLGWGAYRMGFSNTSDPEPGRCRRTDGKKWRCSRDAVVDQKYCERHMNRGRHRSRKPVEGQSGHSVSGPTTTTMLPGSGNTSSLGLSHHHQLKNLQPGSSPANRTFLSKENVGEKRIQDSTARSMLAPNNIGLKESPYEGTTRAEFGRVYSDSLLNPLHKSSSLLSCSTYTSLQDINDRENESQLSVHQFMDDWPKSQTNHSAISWPNVDTQADRTKLSISIPAAAASSPANEKIAFSPLRLSRELDSTQMGLGVGNVANEHNQRLANWIPISWETSVGGPLGEVLHSTSSSAGDCRNSSALNLMTEGWESSPRLGSSPTGVLQKMAFGSLSNSSAGSSPRAESRCNDLLGSTLVTPSSLPAL